MLSSLTNGPKTTTDKPIFWTDWEPQHTTLDPSVQAPSNLEAPNLSICYFDLEIRRTLEECGSWEEVRRSGGISIGCIWNDSYGHPTFFDEHSLPESVSQLEGADVCVSFNGKWFDQPLMETILGRPIHFQEHFDIFRNIKDALNRVNKSWKGHGLDAICQRTLGIGKNGYSENAPRLAKEGKWAELTNYCLRDVLLTRQLCGFVRKNGHIIDVDGDQLFLDLPDWLRL